MIKILCDIDGVLANFFKGFAEFANYNYGTLIDPNLEPAEYDFSGWGFGADKVNWEEAINKWILQDGFLKLLPYDGATEFCNKINNLYDVYFITARVGDFGHMFSPEIVEKVKNNTSDWFKNHNIKANNLMFIRNKVDFCKENGIPILIEDKLKTALRSAKNDLDTVLINRGWNQHPPRFRIYRVKNYDEALKILKKRL